MDYGSPFARTPLKSGRTLSRLTSCLLILDLSPFIKLIPRSRNDKLSSATPSLKLPTSNAPRLLVALRIVLTSFVDLLRRIYIPLMKISPIIVRQLYDRLPLRHQHWLGLHRMRESILERRRRRLLEKRRKMELGDMMRLIGVESRVLVFS